MRGFRFDQVGQPLAFVRRVGELAKRADHHPDISTKYRLILRRATHPAGDVADRDVDLAARTDDLA